MPFFKAPPSSPSRSHPIGPPDWAGCHGPQHHHVRRHVLSRRCWRGAHFLVCCGHGVGCSLLPLLQLANQTLLPEPPSCSQNCSGRRSGPAGSRDDGGGIGQLHHLPGRDWAAAARSPTRLWPRVSRGVSFALGVPQQNVSQLPRARRPIVEFMIVRRAR